MAEDAIVKSVKKYLNELLRLGIPVQYGVLFGSYAQGNGRQWSDIDLLVVSSYFDGDFDREDINLLWRTAARTDNRIEPIPVGLKRWKMDDTSTIIEIARREGVQINV